MLGSRITTFGPKSGVEALLLITLVSCPLPDGAADALPARAKIATSATRIERRLFNRNWVFLPVSEAVVSPGSATLSPPLSGIPGRGRGACDDSWAAQGGPTIWCQPYPLVLKAQGRRSCGCTP